MTVVQPNSIAGINSISVQSGQSLSIHKSDGTLIREIVASTGISTYSSISVGSATTTNNANKSINIGLGASIAQHADNTLSFGTNGIRRVRIDASGNFGINENNPAAYGVFVAKGTGNIVSLNASSGAGSLSFFEGGTGRFYLKTLNGSDGLAFVDADGSSERLRVDSNGRLIIGHTASTGEARYFQIVGTTGDTSSIQLIRHSANASCSQIDLSKSRNATKGSNTIVNDDDVLGQITFRGDDGTDLNSTGATISASVDGTPGANDMPGRLVFSTTADGSNSATERLRITSAGRVGVGVNTPVCLFDVAGAGRFGNANTDKHQDGCIIERSTSDGVVHITAGRSGGNYSGLSFYVAGDTGGSGANAKLRHLIDYQGNFRWYDSDGVTQRLNITTAGNIGVNTSEPRGQFVINSTKNALVNANCADPHHFHLSLRNTDENNTAIGLCFSHDSTVDRVGAAIIHNREGDGSVGDMRFYTSAASGTTSERVRISSAGAIGIAGANYGSSGQVLTSQGSGSAVQWATPSGGISIAQQWRLTSKIQANADPLTGWELVDTQSGGGYGTSMSESSGIWTFPSTGWWLITFHLQAESDNHTQRNIADLRTTTNNSSYTTAASAMQGIYDYNNSYPSHGSCTAQHLFDVTDTSTHKVKLTFGAGQGGEYAHGDSSYTYTYGLFERLGDT